MHILTATIIKDLKILMRDRVGLVMMFFMPVLLVIMITSVQNSTFELVNNNRITVLVYNLDKGSEGARLIDAIEKIGMFKILPAGAGSTYQDISARMHAKDALVAVVVPPGFSSAVNNRATRIAARALQDPDSRCGKTAIYRPARFPDDVLSSRNATVLSQVDRRRIAQCGAGDPGRSHRKEFI